MVAGKFRIEALIGEGGMGVVYKAVHLDLERPVAIKILRDEVARRQDIVERMLREARTTARLRSEHVARVIDVGRLESGTPYIVMEHLEGEDLSTYLMAVSKVPPDIAVSFVLQACDAVAEAHAAGIVHRDLKPDNLFLTTRADGEPIVKVLDFGISKDVSKEVTAAPRKSLTNPHLLIGSPDYMSPERMRTDGVVSAGSDIWSLGAVLYELVTGCRPFEAGSIPATCAAVLTQEPRPPRALEPSIPPGLEQVILCCLRKQSSLRFASVSELARALVPFGPEGSAAAAERISRIASGVRLRTRTTPESLRANIRPSPMPSLPSPTPPRAPPRRLGAWVGLILVVGAATPFVWAAFGQTRAPAQAASQAASQPPATTATSEPPPAPVIDPPVVDPPQPSATPPAVREEAPPPPRPTRRAIARRPAPPPNTKATMDPWNPTEFGGRE